MNKIENPERGLLKFFAKIPYWGSRLLGHNLKGVIFSLNFYQQVFQNLLGVLSHTPSPPCESMPKMFAVTR
jgi:hypothetical protein